MALPGSTFSQQTSLTNVLSVQPESHVETIERLTKSSKQLEKQATKLAGEVAQLRSVSQEAPHSCCSK